MVIFFSHFQSVNILITIKTHNKSKNHSCIDFVVWRFVLVFQSSQTKHKKVELNQHLFPFFLFFTFHMILSSSFFLFFSCTIEKESLFVFFLSSHLIRVYVIRLACTFYNNVFTFFIGMYPFFLCNIMHSFFIVYFFLERYIYIVCLVIAHQSDDLCRSLSLFPFLVSLRLLLIRQHALPLPMNE